LDPTALIAGLARVEIGSAAQSEIVCALENIRRVRARVDAGEVALARRLRELTPLADDDVSRAAQRSNRHGDKIRNRAETAAAIPGLGDAFDAGQVGGEHVDAIVKAVKAAPANLRDALGEAVTELVPEIAAGLTPDQVAQRLADETKRLEADDGLARLERQRRATRLRTWTDKHDGMFESPVRLIRTRVWQFRVGSTRPWPRCLQMVCRRWHPMIQVNGKISYVHLLLWHLPQGFRVAPKSAVIWQTTLTLILPGPRLPELDHHGSGVRK
jgi:hypothetical protein